MSSEKLRRPVTNKLTIPVWRSKVLKRVDVRNPSIDTCGDWDGVSRAAGFIMAMIKTIMVMMLMLLRMLMNMDMIMINIVSTKRHHDGGDSGAAAADDDDDEDETEDDEDGK
ncbi:hypothetical protein AK812_SmicGene58 [Symbiodinium microadriaticum]|uniref:Uncharacterized protein n=1 Tax=Symbiodinium microadriaticum TaxID=2951 RepID=A0A1Q9F7T9_SYMMI|nr:hypothetical protein AK812_SmicGene58 [Symbiodinium microadriaticum]